MTQLLDLPAEVLPSILRYLSIEELLLHRRVCRQFARVIGGTRGLFRTLETTRKWADCQYAMGIMKGLERLRMNGEVRRVRVEEDWMLPDNLGLFLGAFKNVEILHVHNPTCPYSSIWLAVEEAELLPKLNYVYIRSAQKVLQRDSQLFQNAVLTGRLKGVSMNASRWPRDLPDSPFDEEDEGGELWLNSARDY